MARFEPFAAVRPPRALAGLVSTRSYVTYSEEELAHKLGTNPFSFLHVLQRRSPEADARFTGVRTGYEDFLADGYLIPDAEPHLYLYRQQWSGQTFVGYLGLVSLEDYRAGRIIKHEQTLEAREALFARYLETVGFHAEPVLLTHPPIAELSATAAQIAATDPLLDFATTDGAVHTLWAVPAPEPIQAALAKLGRLYIADGHHRMASSERLGEDAHVMAYLVESTQLSISSFHRHIAGPAVGDWVASVGAVPLEKRPEGLPETGFYALDHRGWWRFEPEALAFPESTWLFDHVLAPFWNVVDERHDARVRYEPGVVDLATVEHERRDQETIFVLPHPHWADIERWADQGTSVPPKSTYIEPKLRSGVTLYAWK
ncbi:MAG: DUF1015 family protein [Bacteroidota bacterium]|jgi:uncharacterized protein (DUF1015 family)